MATVRRLPTRTWRAGRMLGVPSGNYSDVTSAIAPISCDLNSAIRYDVNSAANT